MTEQTITPNLITDLQKGMKRRLDHEAKRYQKTVNILHFYTKVLKLRLLALLGFSVLLGLLETFQIVLLYPILSNSMDLEDAGVTSFEPLYTFVSNSLNLPDFVVFTYLFITCVFLSFIITLIYKLLSLQFTRAIVISTKEAIFDKLIENDLQYFVDHKQGDILYTVVSAPGRIREFLELATILASEIVVILSIIVMLFVLSPSGTVLLMALGIGFAALVRIVGKRISYNIGVFQVKSIQSENTVVTDYIHGVRQIRSVCGDDFWKKQYNSALWDYWNRFIKYRFTENLPAAALQFVFLSTIGFVALVLYYLYMEKFTFMIPLIGTFAFSAIKILPRLSTVGTNNMKMMDAWPNLEQVYRFLTDSQYTTMKNGKIQFKSLNSEIIFENVSFSYTQDQQLIEGLNITIPKNKITALVGLSGSGKSTVISLLLRYYDIKSGHILINGTDLHNYDRRTFLKKIGYVSQDAFIYNATIRENITFGRDISNYKIVEAAKKANIHTFISHLPKGYDSLVGDRGITLSGGEKQRIAIARALVQEPEILVLDEATSSLDNEAEAYVQESINAISKNITTFVVAHRLSTIRMADRIYVMSRGRIVESGTHDELIRKKGRYYEIYESGNR